MATSKSNSDLDGQLSLAASPLQARRRSASYPAYSLRQAEDLARIIFDSGARNCDQDQIAQKANYSASSGAFRSLRAAANYFGLIQLEKNGYLSVTDKWIKVFHSEDEEPQQLAEARKQAVLRPNLYKQLVEEYASRQLPTLEKLGRELHLNARYGILKDAAETAARIFLDSIEYAGLLNGKGYLVNTNFAQQSLAEEDNIFNEQDKEPQDKEKDDREGQHKVLESLLNHQPAIHQETHKSELPLHLDELERYEITLVNQKKAYIYVPVPLPYGEKERLKKYIDLILESPQGNRAVQEPLQDLDKDLW